MESWGSQTARVCAAALCAAIAAPLARADHTALTPVPGPQDYALVNMDRFPLVGEEAVQRGQVTGRSRFLLAANTTYRLFKFDRASLRVGYVEFKSGANGARFTIPTVPLRALSTTHDTDQDELSDIAEFVLGTDPNNPDSDGDGVLDGAAAQSGVIGLPLLRTGVIASVQLPGLAQDVCARNDMTAVALGPAGVAITNVFTRMNPEAVGLVDTPGSATRVSISGNFVAVADGPAGLAIVDATDPPVTPIRHQVTSFMLGGNAQCVVAVAGLAFVGLSTGSLVTVDLASGTVLERVPIGVRAIQDVFVGGDALYVLDTHALHALALKPGKLVVSGSVSSPFVAGPNARLFAGGGIAYAVHGKGTNTFSLANPLQPTLITATNLNQFGWKHLVLNGSGLAIAAVSPNQAFDGPHEVNLYDARDPGQTNVFLSQFPTPGVARAVAIFNGLCYAADNDRGLQVINYLPQDRAGIAPTISLSTNQASIDQVEEGALLRVSAACTDDVQVRSVELFVNGLKTETDGNYPFDFYLVAPRLSDREQITVRARVSDTGGNSRFSDELVLRLVPDSTAPQVARVVPPNNGLIGRAGVVAAFFDEPIDPATLTAASFELTWAGPDRLLGTADDAPVSGALELREQVLGAFLTPAGNLAPGRYRAQLQDLRDPAGNQVALTTWEFTVFGVGGADTDGDGLPDELEAALGLDPTKLDTNNNGIPDGQEDFDQDGVPNAVEVALGLDLRSADSDANGIPDALEDRDGDRLPDWREVLASTNVFHHDTDGDTFTDNDEVLAGSNPLDPTSVPLRAWVSATVSGNAAAPAFQLGRELLGLTSRNRAHPGFALGEEELDVTVRNDASPAYKLGEEQVDLTVRNQAAPEAAFGQTQAKPTSVRNDAP